MRRVIVPSYSDVSMRGAYDLVGMIAFIPLKLGGCGRSGIFAGLAEASFSAVWASLVGSCGKMSYDYVKRTRVVPQLRRS